MLSEQQWIDLFKWCSKLIAVGNSFGRVLNEEEIPHAKSIGVQQVGSVHVIEFVDMLPVPESLKALADTFLNPEHAAGLTLDHVILIHKGAYSLRLLRHELRHVRQVEQHTDWQDFMKEYVLQVIRDGYEQAPYEQDARLHEVLTDLA